MRKDLLSGASVKIDGPVRHRSKEAVVLQPSRALRANPTTHRNMALLNELRHDILSHFFDGPSYGLSVGKANNNGLPRKKNTKGLILKQKGTRMAENGNGLEMTILKS